MADLCCCEYYDHSGERNHILACCCNCQDLDESFEGLISRKGVANHNKKGMVLSIKDRLRIPWLGGAKQVTLDAAIAIITLPTFIFIAAISIQSSVISAVTATLLLIFMYKYGTNYFPKFFLWWTFTSVVILYVIFESIVVSFLLILLEENIIVSLFMFSFIFFYLKTKFSGGKDGIITPNKMSEQRNFCNLCNEFYNNGGLKHRYWVDSCITPVNTKYYCGALLSALTALVYTALLTLTTVCHPFQFSLFFNILLPDDCSDVYNLIELGLAFVSASYCVVLSVFMVCELFLVISQNICQVQKLRIRGFFCNCLNFVCSYLGHCR